MRQMSHQDQAHSSAFHALGDPTRRRILVLLRSGERSVGDLAGEFAVTRPAVSQHLKVLRDADLVADRKDGRTRFYRIVPERLREAVDWFTVFDAFWDEKLGALGRHMERGSTHDRSDHETRRP